MCSIGVDPFKFRSFAFFLCDWPWTLPRVSVRLHDANATERKSEQQWWLLLTEKATKDSRRSEWVMNTRIKIPQGRLKQDAEKV